MRFSVYRKIENLNYKINISNNVNVVSFEFSLNEQSAKRKKISARARRVGLGRKWIREEGGTRYRASMKPTRLSNRNLGRRGSRSPVYRLDTKWIKELWRPSETWIMQGRGPIYNSRRGVICVSPCYVERGIGACDMWLDKEAWNISTGNRALRVLVSHLLNWMDVAGRIATNPCSLARFY